MVNVRDPDRMIYNVFLVESDADDCVIVLRQLHRHPRKYRRSLRAELQDALVFVIVADKEKPRS